MQTTPVEWRFELQEAFAPEVIQVQVAKLQQMAPLQAIAMQTTCLQSKHSKVGQSLRHYQTTASSHREPFSIGHQGSPRGLLQNFQLRPDFGQCPQG